MDIQKQKKKDLQTIETFYNKALALLKNNNYKEATNLLYNIMPVELYDSSINLLFNRNDTTISDSLKQLITTVDELLAVNAIDDMEDDDEDLDDYKEFD